MDESAYMLLMMGAFVRATGLVTKFEANGVTFAADHSLLSTVRPIPFKLLIPAFGEFITRVLRRGAALLFDSARPKGSSPDRGHRACQPDSPYLS
jgi:hypothetical protein